MKPISTIINSLAAAVMFVLVFMPDAAYSQSVGAHLLTSHFGGHGMRTKTPGIYYVAENGFTAGAYSNSYGDMSTYAGWTWSTANRRFAVTAGGVTGYAAGPIMPLLVPSVRIPITSETSARLSFIPKPMKHGGAAGLHLSVETKL